MRATNPPTRLSLLNLSIAARVVRGLREGARPVWRDLPPRAGSAGAAVRARAARAAGAAPPPRPPASARPGGQRAPHGGKAGGAPGGVPAHRAAHGGAGGHHPLRVGGHTADRGAEGRLRGQAGGARGAGAAHHMMRSNFLIYASIGGVSIDRRIKASSVQGCVLLAGACEAK
eukprot:1190629-Prorocentrum_minimum.AAC.6